MSFRAPSYRLHKPSGQAVVTLNGRDFYLGPFKSVASQKAYRRLIAEWAASGESILFGVPTEAVTIKQLVAAHLAYLRHRHGEDENSEYHRVRPVYRELKDLYGGEPASSFGPLQYKAVRQTLQDGRRSRQYINKLMKMVRRLFKWAASEGKVPVSVFQTLQTIAPLRRGEADAPESQAITAVDFALVEATLQFLNPIVRDMVRVQMWCGCRPGEICGLTPGMIDRSGDVWIARLAEHKTAYRGKSRELYFGPQAQAVLRPYLLRGENDPLFSPAEAVAARHRERTESRQTHATCGNRPGYNARTRQKRKLVVRRAGSMIWLLRMA